LHATFGVFYSTEMIFFFLLITVSFFSPWLLIYLFDCRHNFDPKRTIMVGDRLNTDIQFGKSGGVATLLVLTGITSEDELTGPNPSPIVPDYVTASIGDLRMAV